MGERERTYAKPAVNVLHAAIRLLPVNEQITLMAQLCKVHPNVIHDPVVIAWIEDNAQLVRFLSDAGRLTT